MCEKQEEFNRLMRECIAYTAGAFAAEYGSHPDDTRSLLASDQARHNENEAWGELNEFIDKNFTPHQQGEVRDDVETLGNSIALAMFNMRHNPRESLLQFEPELAVTQWLSLFLFDSMAMWKRLGQEAVLNNPLGY